MHNYVKFVLGVGLFLLLGFLLYHYMTTLFLPFFIALILVYLIEPIVGLLENKLHMKRKYASGIAVLAMIGLLAAFLSVIIIKAYGEIITLYNILPQHYDKINQEVRSLIVYLESFYLDLPAPVIDLIESNVSKFYGVLEKLLNSFIGLIASLPDFLTILIISAIATFFISKDKELVERFLLRLIPLDWQEAIKKAHQEVLVAVISFIKAQLILITITMIATIIGLTVIGVDYALLIGIVTGVLDLLPVLGPTTLFVPWIIYLFAVQQYSLAVSLLILYGSLLVIRQICEPKIVADALGVHPLASLMAMYVGLKLLGIAGVILGPLTLIALKATIRAGLIPNLPKD